MAIKIIINGIFPKCLLEHPNVKEIPAIPERSVIIVTNVKIIPTSFKK